MVFVFLLLWLKKEKLIVAICLMHVLKSILFLSRQGLPLGSDGSGDSDGNFTHFVET